MKTLFVWDREDYTSAMPIIRKESVRGIIIRDGRIATQRSGQGYYKLLGGGMEPGEAFADALAREVREESGLAIVPESMREIGKVVERHRDLFEEDKVFECHSYYFFVDAEGPVGQPQMTESEIAEGFHLEWALPETIIEANQQFLDKAWVHRDTCLVQGIYDGTYK